MNHHSLWSWQLLFTAVINCWKCPKSSHNLMNYMHLISLQPWFLRVKWWGVKSQRFLANLPYKPDHRPGTVCEMCVVFIAFYADFHPASLYSSTKSTKFITCGDIPRYFCILLWKLLCQPFWASTTPLMKYVDICMEEWHFTKFIRLPCFSYCKH